MHQPPGSLGLVQSQVVTEDIVVIVNNQANQETSPCAENVSPTATVPFMDTSLTNTSDDIDPELMEITAAVKMLTGMANMAATPTAPFVDTTLTNESDDVDPELMEITAAVKMLTGMTSMAVSSNMTTADSEHGMTAFLQKKNKKKSKKKPNRDKNCSFQHRAWKKSKPSLISRMFAHNSRRPYKCGVCDHSYKKFSDLTRHMGSHEQLLNCDKRVCHKKHHQVPHGRLVFGKGYSFQCKAWKKSNQSKSCLTSRVFTRNSRRPYKCGVCDHSFKKFSDLTRHMKLHGQLLNCDKKFYADNMRVRHKKHHQVPHRSLVGGKGFGDQAGLVIHNRKHTNEKPFWCKECNSCFTSNCAALRHERTHLGGEPYMCSTQTSGKVFHACGSLRRHRVKHHTEAHPQVEAPSGQEYIYFVKFKSPVVILDKSENVQFRCRYCNKTYAKKGSYRKHEKIHTSTRRFNCSYCSKAFMNRLDQVVHERMHTGERPYHCEFCVKAFPSTSRLNRHIKIHHGN